MHVSNRLYAETITELYPQLLDACLQQEPKVSPRGMEVREILDFSFVVNDVSQPYVLQKERKANYAYLIIEPILLTMPQTPATVPTCCFYVGKFLREHVVNPKTGLFDGWYGDRINRNGQNQLIQVYELLKKDPDSRRAVITIHSSHEELDREDGLDIPCTLTLQFLIRNKKLEMIVNMRGNDVMLGTPQNFAMWTFFQRMMAKWLGIKTGAYHHRVGSMHLYERDVEKARRIVANPEPIRNRHITERNWGWTIEDPKLSLIECDLFASAEKEYRLHGTTRFGSFLEPFLSDIFFDIIIPYIDEKKAARQRAQ